MDKDGQFEVSNFKNGLGKYYFRKVGPCPLEYKIVKIISQRPHTNIVNFFVINTISLDMEILDTEFNISNEAQALKLITDMKNARNHLLSNGIVYIDWKLDNIGWSEEEQVFKLFDFDVSGIYDIKTSRWINEPNKYFAYNLAVKNNITDPVGIDSFNFNKMVDELLMEF
jgi:hypothetical protein